LPSRDTSIRFDLTDVREEPSRYVHVRDGTVQVCDTDLGFEIDVHITSTLDVMTRVWYGEVGMTNAIGDRQIKVDAAPAYCRRIKRWLRISSFTTDNPSFASA
jgi:hypothetical protein